MSETNEQNERDDNDEKIGEKEDDAKNISEEEVENIYHADQEIKGKLIQAADLKFELQCDICKCSYRLEADQVYIDSIDPVTGVGTYRAVENFLKSKGLNISWYTCKNHADKHIRIKYDDQPPINYGDRIFDMRQELSKCDNQIDTVIAVLFERLYKLGAYSNSASLDENIDVTDSMTTISDKLARLWKLKADTLKDVAQESSKNQLLDMCTNLLTKLPEEYHDIIREEMRKIKLKD
jgi:hypothetical protein